jgi:hypothetical protein
MMNTLAAIDPWDLIWAAGGFVLGVIFGPIVVAWIQSRNKK